LEGKPPVGGNVFLMVQQRIGGVEPFL